MERRRYAQLTNPVKLSNPDVQENSESRGLWHLKMETLTLKLVQ